MSDLISRQAAIDALAKAMPSLTTPDGSGAFDHDIQIADEAFVDAMQIIQELPSAQPDLSEYSDKLWRNAYERGKRDTLAEPHWIPCSERLPSKADHTDDMVLVCYRNGSVRFNTYMNGWVQGNPVAWMPLPEPYKAKMEGEE